MQLFDVEEFQIFLSFVRDSVIHLRGRRSEKKLLLVSKFTCTKNNMAILSRRIQLLAILFYKQFIHHTKLNLRRNKKKLFNCIQA